MPEIGGLLEAALFVEDVSRSVAFYEEVLGLERLTEPDERGCAFHVGSRQVLLIVARDAAGRENPTPGGVIPACAGERESARDRAGPGHVALDVRESDFERWRRRLEEHDLDPREVRFERGGRSLYARDPDGHLIELATPGIWPFD